jgi:hypothetical protein
MPDPDAYRPQIGANPAQYGSSKAVLTIGEVAYYAKNFIKRPFRSNPDGDIAVMVAIAMAESGGNILAHNSRPPDDSYGLWQINMIGALGVSRRAAFGLKKNEDLYNPAENARVAGLILFTSGFQSWSSYRDGKYWKYLKEARAAVANPTKPESVVSGAPTNTTNFITEAVDGFQNFIAEGALRIGGFIGGAGLIIMAVVLLGKKGVK